MSSGYQINLISPLALLPAAIDDLDPIAVRIFHEAKERAALPDTVGLPLGLDALLLQRCEGLVEVVHADRDVAVAGANVVRATVVVEGELELLLLAREGEEVVRGLELAVANDRQVA